MHYENGFEPPKTSGKNKGKMSGMANSFVIAQWPDSVWDLFAKIMDSHPNYSGKKKGGFVQPLAVTQFRQLTGKLTEREHISMLSKVLNGECTLKEMGDLCVRLRRIKKVKFFMVLDLKMADWAELKLKFGKFATTTEVGQWELVASQLENKTNKRPPGWTKWIRKIIDHKRDETLVLNTAETKQFQFGGCDYTFHCNSVVNCFSLLGMPPRDYGVYFFLNFCKSIKV